MPRVQIYPLETLEEFRQCERIQKEVWGNAGVGSELLGVTQKYGGVVLGAVVRSKVVGFLYALLGRYHGRLIHWSHLMAVIPEYRDLGLGYRMKVAHRRLALEQGLRSICWTYDPLQSRNAALNIARLGASVEEYVPDCYGQFPSVIERKLPSDRFVADWRIATARVERRLREGVPRLPASSLPQVNETRLSNEVFVENRKIDLKLHGPRLLVEIPANTDAMRAQALQLARRWRLETRKIFQHYFSAGYRVEDFIPPSVASGGRCFYVLRRLLARG